MDNVQLPIVKLAAKPDKLLLPTKDKDKDSSQKILETLVALFSQSKVIEPARFASPLDTLLTDGFDAEQIWAQLELANGPLLKYFNNQKKKLTDPTDELQIFKNEPKPTQQEDDDSEAESDDVGSAAQSDEDEDEDGRDDDNNDDDDDDDDDDNDDDEDGDEDEDDDDEGNDDDTKDDAKPKKKVAPKKALKPKKKANIVDDEFFQMDQMEAFLKEEDEREMRGSKGDDEVIDDEDAVDLFEGDDEDDDNVDTETADADAKYSEYFEGELEDEETNDNEGDNDDDDDDDVDDDDVDEDDEDEENTLGAEDGDDADADADTKDLLDDSEAADPEADEGGLSLYEKRQRKFQQQIDDLEERNVGDKPWQLAGEVQALARPIDSLLQEDLDFEVTSRPAPEITEESTKTLEQTIIQRIKDQAFDDVDRKADPSNLAAYKPRAVGELDSEKSKVGLGEMYGDVYARQSSGTKTTAAEEKLTKEHDEINLLFKSLFAQLDSLTNHNYTPEAVETEISVVKNVAAISMEDATPMASTLATKLAPEELVHKTKSATLVADGEKTSTDKKRERRAKKKMKHLKRLETESKEQQRENDGILISRKSALKKLETAKNTTMIKDSGVSTSYSSTAVFKRLSEQQQGGGVPKKIKKTSDKSASELRL